MKFPCPLLATTLWMTGFTLKGSQIEGRVTDRASSNSITGARATLFTPDLRFFREVRSGAGGAFAFPVVGYEYVETSLNVSNLVETADFQLRPETNGGRWTIVGNTEPELLDGSGSGTLLPTGEIFFCHDTQQPIMFDPVSGIKWYPPDSLSAQCCHITTVNTDGGMFLTGGSMGGNPLDPVVKFAKSYFMDTVGNAGQHQRHGTNS